MNIFVLDPSPVVCAGWMGDQHVRKMLVESCQMLCLHLEDWQLNEAPRTVSGNIRTVSHPNHPCSQWVCNSWGNWWWLYQHALALLHENVRRGFKCDVSEGLLEWIWEHQPFGVKTQPTPFVCAISPEMKCRRLLDWEDLTIHEKYQAYYFYDKLPFLHWTLTEIPAFCRSRFESASSSRWRGQAQESEGARHAASPGMERTHRPEREGR